jgi:hypothetical protein
MAHNSDILKKRLLEALEKSLGIVTSACKKAKVARSTYYEYLHNDPDFKAEVESIQDMALDFAETKLMQSINNGSDTATIFYLKTKGKKRGYVERQELDHTTGGEPLNALTTTVFTTKKHAPPIEQNEEKAPE